MRRFGEQIRKDVRYKVRPGAYGILFDGEKVLLTFQEAPVPEFQLPGGGIDPGESPVPALHREVMEETGWTIAEARRLGFYRRYAFMPEYDLWAEKVALIYLARPILRQDRPLEAGHTAVWLKPEEALPLLANEGDQHFFMQAMGL